MSKIIGNTTATPNPRPDWNQTDESKADYIKNKPQVYTGVSENELILIDRITKQKYELYIDDGKLSMREIIQESEVDE